MEPIPPLLKVHLYPLFSKTVCRTENAYKRTWPLLFVPVLPHSMAHSKVPSNRHRATTIYISDQTVEICFKVFNPHTRWGVTTICMNTVHFHPYISWLRLTYFLEWETTTGPNSSLTSSICLPGLTFHISVLLTEDGNIDSSFIYRLH